MGVQQLLGLAWADGLSCTLPSVVGDASAVEEGTFQEASRDADVLDLSGVVRITSSSCTSPREIAERNRPEKSGREIASVEISWARSAIVGSEHEQR